MCCCIDVYCSQMQDYHRCENKSVRTWCVTLQEFRCDHRGKPDCTLLRERRERSEICGAERIRHYRKLRDGLKGGQDVHQHLFTHKGSHFYCINLCQYVHYYVYYNVLLGFRFVYRPSIRANSIPSDVKKVCYIFSANIHYWCISWKSCIGQTLSQKSVVEGRGLLLWFLLGSKK